ncbi:MAG TPA: hypothetical protein VGH42_14260 [Verrucomicrobiae bacterium]|jgi:hypothetical protein
MYKSNKVFWSVIAGLIALIIAAVIVTALFLDKIVKKGVETVGPQITKVSVTLDEVHLGVLTGSAKVKNLVIGNPDGYKTPNAISIGLAEVGVDPTSIFSDKIIVHTIRVESPEITFEGGLGGNNLSKIMDNVNGVAKSGGPAPASTTTGSKPARKIEVDDLLITGAKVNGTLILFGGKEVPIPSLQLPDIHLTDLGKGSDGLTATDLTRAVLSAITTATIKVVGSDATDIGKGAENLGKGGVNQIKNGLGGLLGK